MNTYTFFCDFCFDVTANNYEDAVEKGWNLIKEKIPNYFCFEGSELTLIDTKGDNSNED